MRRGNPLNSLCLVAAAATALILLAPDRAESTHELTCPQFDSTQWALVSIVDDEGFELHDADPLHHAVPVELQLSATAQSQSGVASPVLLCMESDSWSTGVASCGFPLEGVQP